MSIEKARIAARKALERMYQGRVTVIEYQKIKDEWGHDQLSGSNRFGGSAL